MKLTFKLTEDEFSDIELALTEYIKTIKKNKKFYNIKNYDKKIEKLLTKLQNQSIKQKTNLLQKIKT